MKRIELTVKHCIDVLDAEICIGRDKALDKKKKEFSFNSLKNEYSVWHDDYKVDSGQAIEELLNVYNEL